MATIEYVWRREEVELLWAAVRRVSRVPGGKGVGLKVRVDLWDRIVWIVDWERCSSWSGASVGSGKVDDFLSR